MCVFTCFCASTHRGHRVTTLSFIFLPIRQFLGGSAGLSLCEESQKKKVGAPLRLSIVARAPNVREISARSVRLPRHLLRKGYDCTFVVCCVFIFDEDPHLEELFLYLTPTP